MADPIEREGILEIIPHRYENVLLDRMARGEVDGLPNGQGYLCLERGDADARDIFLVKDIDGSEILPICAGNRALLALSLPAIFERRSR